MPRRRESKVSKRLSYAHVHSSVMHYTQKVEAIQVSINRWLDKQNVVYTHKKELLLILKIQGNSDTCSNMDQP
jgi:hypothetical protein